MFSRIIYTLFILFIGWLSNIVIDIQFALGVVSGWLMKEGYDSIAKYLLSLL